MTPDSKKIPDTKMPIHEERDRKRNPYSALTKEQEPEHDDYSEESSPEIWNKINGRWTCE